MYLLVFRTKAKILWIFRSFIWFSSIKCCLNILYLMLENFGHSPMKWCAVSGFLSPHCLQCGELVFSMLDRWYSKTLWPVSMCVHILTCCLVIFCIVFHIFILTFGIVIFDCLCFGMSSQYFWCFPAIQILIWFFVIFATCGTGHPGSAQATCRSTEILPVAYTKMSIKSFTIEIFQF